MDEFTVIGAGGKPKPGTLSPSPCSPAATSVVTDREDKRYRTPFEWLATYDPGSITTRWRKSLGENFCCAFCNRKEKHHPLKCPLLGELDLKLIDISGGNHGSFLGSTPLAGTQGAALPATPPAAAPAAVVPPPAPALGSPSAPAGLTATVDEGDESSMDSFCWDGDDDGVDFKPNGSVSMYPPSTVSPLRPSPPSPTPSAPSCSRVSLESALPGASYGRSLHQLSLSEADPLPDDIILPPGFVSAVHQAISPKELVEGLQLVVADTSATDHMVLDRLAFISYKTIRNLRVQMGNNSFAPVLGRGTAIILLNGQHILICHVLHIPALCVPFYSLRAQLRQWGCGFVGTHNTGMHVYFPGVVLSVDTLTKAGRPPFPPSTMSNLTVLPPLTRIRTLRFALRWILLPQCWLKMMMRWSCWAQSPPGWASCLLLSHHLSSPPSSSAAQFPRFPLFGQRHCFNLSTPKAHVGLSVRVG